jgi:archaemetzincin
MRITIVPFYLGNHEHLLDSLRTCLEQSFGVASNVHPPTFDPEQCFDPARGQYNSRSLLALLLREPIDETRRVLSVCSVDLFIPVLTYVFGEAQLQGRAAVVSAHRLRPELYGLPPDPDLLDQRLRKEAVHELGHTYGLLHCADAACVMHSSTYVEEIDLKTVRFCRRCTARVRSAPPLAPGRRP